MNDPEATDAEATLGLLLAGGRSTRMRGEDKALAKLCGQPLIAYAWDRLAAQCAGIAVSVNHDPGRFAIFGAPLLPADPPEAAGPLAGVLAGLEHARAHTQATHVVSLPVDTPFAPRDLVSKLQAARRATGAEIVTARSARRAHHVVALWSVELAAELRAAQARVDSAQAALEYENVRLYLHPGDRLLLFSDGVIEARDRQGKLLGFERARELTRLSAAQIVQAAQSFGQEDDITVLTLDLV